MLLLVQALFSEQKLKRYFFFSVTSATAFSGCHCHVTQRKSLEIQTCSSLRSWRFCKHTRNMRNWRYCKRTRNKVLAAEPTSERRSREENGRGTLKYRGISRGFAARFWRLRRQNFISRAPTIPPATQAKRALLQ